MPEPTHQADVGNQSRPEFENQLRRALAVPEPSEPSLLALRAKVITRGVEHLRPKSSTDQLPLLLRLGSPRSLVWKFILLLLTVAVLLSLFSPQVVNALRSLFGYIPQVGMVDPDAPILTLAEPVSQTRDGFVVTIEQAIAAGEKTVVIYRHVDPPEGSSGDSSAAAPSPASQPALRLADGSKMDVIVGRRQPTNGAGILYALEFGPLPAGVDAVTLELTYLAGLAPGAGPENWQMPLRFKPGDPAQLVYPVTVYPLTPTTVATIVATTAAAETTQSTLTVPQAPSTLPAPGYGASIMLEKAVELPEGYLLIGSLTWTEPAVTPQNLTLGGPLITDANGQPVDFIPTQPDSFPQPGELRKNWAIQISSGFTAPLRLEFYITASESADVRFQFDPGPNPQDGQTWDLNLDLPVNRFQIQVHSAKYFAPAADNRFIEFSLTADQNVIGATVIDANHPPMGSGGGGAGVPQTNVPFSSSFWLEDGLTGQPLTVAITGLEVLVPGDWVIEWSPGSP